MIGQGYPLPKFFNISVSIIDYGFCSLAFPVMLEKVLVVPYAPCQDYKHIPINIRCLLSKLLVNLYEIALGIVPSREFDS